MELEWMARGLCSNVPPSRFFPNDGAGVELARKICADCPVKEPCLEHALVHRIDHGVGGGCSERERRRILKRRRAERAAAIG
jgi:WhiB family redox-sensing transcriptional regulator